MGDIWAHLLGRVRSAPEVRRVRANLALDRLRNTGLNEDDDDGGVEERRLAVTDTVKDFQEMIKCRSRLQLQLSSARLTLTDQTAEVSGLKSTRKQLLRSVRETHRTTCSVAQLEDIWEKRLEGVSRDSDRLKSLHLGVGQAEHSAYLPACYKQHPSMSGPMIGL